MQNKLTNIFKNRKSNNCNSQFDPKPFNKKNDTK